METKLKNKTSLDKLIENHLELPDDIETLNEILSEEIDITNPQFTRSLETRLKPVKDRIESQKATSRHRAEWVLKFRNFILGTQESFSVFVAFLLQVIFPFVGIALFVFTEVYATYMGISLIWQNEEFAALLVAVTIVTGYYVIEWLHARAYYQYHQTNKRYRFSLLRLLTNLWYTFGAGAIQWSDGRINLKQPEEIKGVTLLDSMKLVRWLAILSIIMGGLLARMGDELAQYNNIPAGEGLTKILNESSIFEFAEYATVFILTFGILQMTHFVIKYIYQLYIKAVGSEEVDFFDSASAQEELERITRQYLKHRLNIIRAEKLSHLPQVITPLTLEGNVPMPVLTSDIPLNENPLVMTQLPETYQKGESVQSETHNQSHQQSSQKKIVIKPKSE
jgi:D-ribose pyranose/furanose isomerase RbsD